MMQLLKKLHKWVGLLIGIQVLLWLLSGLVISLLDPVKVSGRQWAAPAMAEPQFFGPTVLLEPAELPTEHLKDALGIELTIQHGKPVYLIRHTDGETLVNGIDGSVITFGKADAETLARQDFSGDGEVISVEQGMAPDMESRNHTGTYWRIDFSDKANTAIYIAASTGKILERRNSFWRVRDFFWMLHIMDYSGRQNFNHPLIITVALVAIWLGLSGFLLIFGSKRGSIDGNSIFMFWDGTKYYPSWFKTHPQYVWPVVSGVKETEDPEGVEMTLEDGSTITLIQESKLDYENEMCEYVELYYNKKIVSAFKVRHGLDYDTLSSIEF